MLDGDPRPLLRVGAVRNHGKVDLGMLVLLALLAGGAYALVMFVPVYVDHLDVKEAVSAAHNMAGRNPNDAYLRSEIRQRTGQMSSHVERDTWNVEHVVPGLGLTDDQILIERSSVMDNVRIEVDYDRDVVLKPSNYVYTLHMRAVTEGPPPR